MSTDYEAWGLYGRVILSSVRILENTYIVSTVLEVITREKWKTPFWDLNANLFTFNEPISAVILDGFGSNEVCLKGLSVLLQILLLGKKKLNFADPCV